MDIPIRLTAFAVLIALTAFFVIAEFSIVKMRSSRVDQLVEAGHPKAQMIQTITSRLDEYLAACQLGITMMTIGIGMLAEPTMRRFLQPFFSNWSFEPTMELTISFGLAFTIATFLHVIFGEMMPKAIALQKAESMMLKIARPLTLFYFFMYPLIKLLNGTSHLLMKLFGLEPISQSDVSHTEEELRLLLSDSYRSGEINKAEYKFVNKIFEFDDRVAKEIMVPRTEMMTLDRQLTLREVFEVSDIEQFTRYPVTDGDKDTIIGLVNMKHLLTAFIKDPAASSQTVEQHTQPIIHAIETMNIGDLLLNIQRERIHMAVIVDEYGGTSGLVTIEDILEEIVGEIQDEFDTDEVPEIQKLSEGHYIFDAKVLLDEVNETLGISIVDEDIDTIGGWFMTQYFELGTPHFISEQNYQFYPLEVDGHHISYVEAKQSQSESE